RAGAGAARAGRLGARRGRAGLTGAYNRGMLARALLVLLLVMNLSVAAWWATHAAQAPVVRDDAIPSGIPRLRMLSEDAGAAEPAAAPAARCLRFGPYGDAGSLAVARERAVALAGPRAAGITTTIVPGPVPDRWRVAAPRPEDGDSAALATRIVAA